MVAFALTMRIGEALNPGPTLGNLNPTGMMNKTAELSSLPGGVYAVQETHLTGLGIQQFKRELQWKNSPFQLNHGPPAPPQSSSIRAIGGKQTGVAFISAYPIRQLHHHWTQAQHGTSRCHIAAAFVDQQWITCGTVYGYSANSRSLQVQQNTDELLQGLTSRIVDGAQGPRMLAGDWNMEREKIPQAEYWESRGWIEAQVYAQKTWSRPGHL